MESMEPLSGEFIAKVLNTNKLYSRRDGQFLNTSQIGARISHYPELIKRNNNGKYEIINRALHSFRITYNHLIKRFAQSKLSSSEVRLIAASIIFISWQNLDGRIIKQNLERQDFLDLFRRLVDSLKNKGAFVDFLKLLDTLDVNELYELFSVVHTPHLTKETSNDAFALFFNNIINEYTTTNEVKEGWHSTPPEICKFITNLVKLEKPNGKIFDPFVGYGSLLAEAYTANISKNPTIVGGDIVQHAIQIAELNLNAHGNENSYLYHKNAFSGWGNSIYADLILTTPPVGMRVPVYALHNKFDEFESILIDLGLAFSNFSNIDSSLASVMVSLAHLNNSGKAAIVVSNSLLYSNRIDSVTLKSFLLTRGWLEGVISLPSSGFRPFHNAQCSVFLVNKRNSKNGEVFFCDLSSETMESLGKVTEQVCTALQNRGTIPNLTSWVSYEKIDR